VGFAVTFLRLNPNGTRSDGTTAAPPTAYGEEDVAIPQLRWLAFHSEASNV